MRSELISHDRLIEILLYCPGTGIFTWKVSRGARAGAIAGATGSDGYRFIRINRRRYAVHRLAYFYMEKTWPPRDIDHWDLDKANNRWGNLRLATDGQNIANSKLRKDNSSGIKGVYWVAKEETWQAGIRVNGVYKTLGRFRRIEDAASCREAAAKRYFGCFARVA